MHAIKPFIGHTANKWICSVDREMNSEYHIKLHRVAIDWIFCFWMEKYSEVMPNYLLSFNQWLFSSSIGFIWLCISSILLHYCALWWWRTKLLFIEGHNSYISVQDCSTERLTTLHFAINQEILNSILHCQYCHWNLRQAFV